MKRILPLIVCLLLGGTLLASPNSDSLDLVKYIRMMDSVNKALNYQTGSIKLDNGLITLNVPEGFKYLNSEQSNFVIEKIWGNLPQSDIQGMLFPVASTPFEDSSYAFVIRYQSVGYVKDKDADEIDYDKLMKDMQKEEIAENKERAKAGISSIHTVGWASKPFYDKEQKVLHWALNLKAEDAIDNTLNYRIMLLGRKGLLSLTAVAPLYALDSVKRHINEVLAIPSFTDGNKYSDFDPKVDEVAAWTIGGLVAGKVLAKVGLFAIFLKYIKLIIIGLGAAGAAIWKFMRRKKEEPPVEPEPSEAQAEQ